jgi:hypothetical protein
MTAFFTKYYCAMVTVWEFGFDAMSHVMVHGRDVQCVSRYVDISYFIKETCGEITLFTTLYTENYKKIITC